MAFSGLGSFIAPTTTVQLVPHLKPGRNAHQSPPPDSFEMPKGKLRVPRSADPPTPDFPTASMARRGHLNGILRDGHLFPASELIGQVSAQTAKISLDDTWDFQPRQLSALPHIADDMKSLRNLFYISVEADELPSFHFWTGPDDHDPLEKEKSINPFTRLEKRKPEDKEKYNDEQEEDPDISDLSNAPPPETQAALESGFGKPLSPIGEESDPAEQRPKKEEVTSAPGLHRPDAFSTINTQGVPDWLNRKVSTTSSASGKTTAARRPSMFPGFGASSSAQSPGFGQSPFLDDMGSRKGSMLVGSEELYQDEPRKSSELLYCERGGMHLHKFSSRTFSAIALYLVNQEENETVVGGAGRFVDILKPKRISADAVSLVGSGRTFDMKYGREIAPFLGVRDHHFRIRSDAYEKSAPWDNGGRGSLKMTRIDVGYCYVNAAGSWGDAKQRKTNTERFESALNFLYGWDRQQKLDALKKADEPEKPDPPDTAMPTQLTIEILAGLGCPNAVSYNIERGLPIPTELEEIFDELSNLDPLPGNPHDRIQCRYSKEIFVHETDTEFVPPFTAVTEQKAEAEKEEEQAEEDWSHEQQKASDPNEPIDAAGQPDRSHLSIMPQATMLDYPPGHTDPLTGPRRPTPSEVGNLERRVGVLGEQLRETQAAYGRLQVEMEVLEGEKKALQMGNEVLQNEKQVLQNEKAEWERNKEALEKSNAWKSNQVHTAEEEHLEMLEQRKELRDELRTITQERDQLRVRVDGLKREFEKIDNLSEYPGETDDTEVRELREERDLLKSRVEELERKSNEQGRGFRQPQDRDGREGEANEPDQGSRRSQDRDNLEGKADEEGQGSRESQDLEDGRTDLQHAGLPSNPPGQNSTQQDAVAPAPHMPSGSADPKKLLYCNVCLTSVNTLDEKRKTTHAQKCNTSVDQFILLTMQEAKARRAAKKATEKAVETPAPPKGKRKRTAKADEEENDELAAGPSNAQEESKEDSQSTGAAPLKGKRKRTAKADEEDNDELAAGPSKVHEELNDDAQSTDRPSKRRRNNVPEPPANDEPEETAGARPRRSKKPTLKAQTTSNNESGTSAASISRPRVTRSRGQASAAPAQVIEPDGDSSPEKSGPAFKRISGWDDDDPRQPPRKRSKK